MKNLLLIVNPVAGKMRLRGALLDILKIYGEKGYRVTTAVTLYRGHGTELAAEAEALGFDQVVCCGGDGTLNECLSGIISSKSTIPVGYIPCGSTNDFADTLNLAITPERAAEKTVIGEPFSLDVGLFNNERYFSYIASFGAFTETSYNVPQAAKNKLGHFAYLLGGIKDLRDLKSYKVSLKTENFECSGKYIFGAVSNTTSVAGIVKLSGEQVNLHDGKFEVMLVKTPEDLLQLQQIINCVALSDFENSDMIVFRRANHFEFSMNGNVCWSLDGEAAPGGRNVHISCLPSAATLIK